MLILLVSLAILNVDANGTADSDNDADDGPDIEEGETPSEAELSSDGGLVYTADWSEAELKRRFLGDLPSLGSVSVGLAESGRVINGVQLRANEHIEVVDPQNAWGTQETISYLEAVAEEVASVVPTAAPLRVNHIGRREGGYLRPHFSHQSGRDVDLGFYYRPNFSARALKNQTRIAAMDMEANWALVKALAAKADVQVILLDKKVQAALHDYAAQKGEDPSLLFALFKAGANAKFRHARKHKDHFHVRFFSPKAQELGRRVQPLLAQRPDENKVIHRVRKGETLGQLARKYGSSVAMIQKASGLKGHFLSLGRTLVVPLRGPCTKCPTAPVVVVPPRLLAAGQNAVVARGKATTPPQCAPFDEALRSPYADWVGGGEVFSPDSALSGISMRTWVQR